VAKSEMIKAGIPVVPGSEGNVESADQALSIAKEIGYPVILKAALGGGGRGMKIVREPEEMKTELELARAEAETAFSDSAVYIEKYIENPRHIEIQLLGDRHGNMVHLGERECSIQRRHQKMIEESPSVAVTPALREKMGRVAVQAAERLNFHNVSTIEFLLDSDGQFYFMEMNTRIQVEHGVTGLVTNKDLIKEQILMAMGEKLSFAQKDVTILGHAIECRINAEDVKNDFMPSAGKITGYHAPTGTGVRVDSHIFENYEIPPFYDSLVSKLLVLGNDRIDAIIKTKYALMEYVILGVETNLAFQLDLISNERFIVGDFNTNFLDEYLADKEGP